MTSNTVEDFQSNCRVGVLGAGNFGTCLAQHLATKGHQVTIWGRDSKVIADINQTRFNTKHLPDYKLHNAIRATNNINDQGITKCDALVVAIPTQSLRSALTPLASKIPKTALVICAAKGIENGSGMFPRMVINETLNQGDLENDVVLSGPSFAVEIVKSLPTCVSVASTSSHSSLLAQALFHAPHFRSYTSQDPIGLEVSGAMKNVIALAAGACDGLGFENNARAALITRGLAEITRIGLALGANPITFNGLGGVGDLFLTCTSLKSRNYKFGYDLGKGKSVAETSQGMLSVAEGVATTKAAFQKTKELGVDAPITNEVYQVLYEGKSVRAAVIALVEREPKPEWTAPDL